MGGGGNYVLGSASCAKRKPYWRLDVEQHDQRPWERAYYIGGWGVVVLFCYIWGGVKLRWFITIYYYYYYSGSHAAAAAVAAAAPAEEYEEEKEEEEEAWLGWAGAAARWCEMGRIKTILAATYVATSCRGCWCGSVVRNG